MDKTLTSNLESINTILREETPGTFFLASFSQKSLELTTAFTFEGGPKEHKSFLVKFKEAIIFHVPCILHSSLSASVVFRIAPYQAADQYIPAVSFDEEEFGETGFKIFVLENMSGVETGYYIAAKHVESEWMSLKKGNQKWGIW